MQLNRAMIFVKDLPRMAGVLPAEFEGGAVRFSLHVIPAEIANQIQISSPPRPRETSPVKLSFEVDDVLAECRRLESLGVAILRRPWGGYEGVDPEGNIFGICSVA